MSYFNQNSNGQNSEAILLAGSSLPLLSALELLKRGGPPFQ